MSPYIWAAVGALIGWFAGGAMLDKAYIARIESVAVGIFGAVALAQVHLALFAPSDGPAAATGFQPVTLVGASVGAVLMVVVLVFFRRMVGPLRARKKKAR